MWAVRAPGPAALASHSEEAWLRQSGVREFPTQPNQLSDLKLTIISRSIFVEPLSGGRFFQDVGGPHIDGLASYFSKVYLVSSVVREGKHQAFADLPPYRYVLSAPNLEMVEIPFPSQKNPGIPTASLLLLKAAPRIAKVIAKSDLVMVFLPGMRGVLGALLARYLGKPYILYIGSEWRSSGKFAYHWSRSWEKKLLPLYLQAVDWIERIVVRLAHFVLVAGDSLLTKYQDQGLCVYRTRPVVWVRPQTSADLCRQPDGESLHLLYVGTLLERKGVVYLLEALRLLHCKGYSVDLTIVGSGPQRANLQTKAHELGLSDIIRFTGYIPNGPSLFDLYLASDVFVLPTLAEGFPRVLVEAMALGVPIVATQVDGIRDSMKDGSNALLVSPHSAVEITTAIEQLIRDPKLRQQLASNGLRTATDLLSVSAVEQTVELIARHLNLGTKDSH